MGTFVKLTANALDNAGVTLVDGATSTGYKLLIDDHMGGMFGSVNPIAIFAASIDQAPTKVAEAPAERTVTMNLRVNAASQSALVTKLRALTTEVRNVNRFKGRLRLRAGSLTYPVELVVEHASITELWSNMAETGYQQDVELTLTCQPLALMDPMDISDSFAVDSLGTAGVYNNGGADWTFDNGSSDTAVSSGTLAFSATLTTERRMYHSGTPYEYQDSQSTILFTPGTIANGLKAGVILKRIDASNRIEVYVDDTGAASRLRIDTIEAGVTTNRASSTLGTRLAAGSFYYVRGRVEGNTVYAEMYTLYGPLRVPRGGSDIASAVATSYTLTGSPMTTLGVGTDGRNGIVCNPQHASTAIHDWDSIAYCYRGFSASAELQPRDLRLHGAIPGDAPALVDWYVSPYVNGYNPASHKPSVLLGWADDDGFGTRNLVDAPLGTTGSFTNVSGWNVSTVTGVVTAASTISIDGGGYQGDGMCAEVTTPATSGTGCNRMIGKPFKAGVTYTAKALIRADSSTTATRIALGVNGDLGSGSTANLSTSWQEISVTWTPTANVAAAYVAVKINAATATTFEFTRVRVYEGTGTLTYWEGAQIPFGVIQGESMWGMDGYTFTNQSSANYLGGVAIGTASGTLASLTWDAGYHLEYLIEPWSMQPNYGKSVAVEVWANVELDSTRTDLRIPVWTQPVGVTTTTAARFSVEYGKTGKRVKAPSSGTVRRFTFLGTVVFECDPNMRAPQSLRIGPASNISGNAFAIDYLVLVPSGNRAGTPTGLALADYPGWLQDEYSTRLIKSDLSGYTVNDPMHCTRRTGGFTPSGGLIGNPIQFQPQREALVVARFGYYTFDYTDSNGNGEDSYNYASLQFSVTPRVDLWAS